MLRISPFSVKQKQKTTSEDNQYIVWIKDNKLISVLHNAEDGRLIVVDGQTLVIFTVPLWDKNSGMYLSILDSGKKVKIHGPSSFIFTKVEKNWVPFTKDDQLYLIYSLSPKTIIFKVNIYSGYITDIYESTCKYKFNPLYLRGGTPLIEWTSKYFLGVGHINNNGIYSHFAYLIDNEPPFALLKMSKIFRFQTEDNIEFASGLFQNEEDNICITYGVGDFKSRILTISNKKIDFILENYNILDKCYLINLDKSVDRLNTASKDLHPIFNKVVRFPAILGKNKPLVKSVESYLRIKENFNKKINPDIPMNVGQIGCALSHLLLYKQLLDSDDEYYFIFEDDIQLCKNFKKVFFSFWGKTRKDFEILFVGNQLNSRENILEIVDKKDDKLNFITSKRTICTHSYIITRKGAEKVLKFVRHYGYRPIDIDIITMNQSNPDRNIKSIAWVKEIDDNDKSTVKDIYLERSSGLVYQKGLSEINQK